MPIQTGKSWGFNVFGQLGNGMTGGISDVPVQVVGSEGVGCLTSLRAISAGGAHSLALLEEKSVYAWGFNASGQLGNGMTGVDSDIPVQVKGLGGVGLLSGVVAIAGGGNHSLALLEEKSVYAWGDNTFGQLGNGMTGGISDVPVQVVDPGGMGTLSGVVAIAGGGNHSLALLEDGSVYAWGNNSFGQLGVGFVGGISDVPVQVKGLGGIGTLSGVVAITAGAIHSLALLGDGGVYAWGNNSFGQLGIGLTGGNSDVPVQVVDPGGMGTLSGVVAIAGGGNHSLALLEDGSVYAWGDNSNGQLGNGMTGVDSDIPVQVKGLGGVGTLSGVQAIAGGGNHSLALLEDGSVYAWGRNSLGELGNGTTGGNSDVPVQVVDPGGMGMLSGVVAIAARSNHNLAITSITFDCPSDITVVANAGDTGKIVNYPSPTLSDNCANITFNCNPPSGSFFPCGTTPVTCVATDTSRNVVIDTCSFHITVNCPSPPSHVVRTHISHLIRTHIVLDWIIASIEDIISVPIPEMTQPALVSTKTLQQSLPVEYISESPCSAYEVHLQEEEISCKLCGIQHIKDSDSLVQLLVAYTIPLEIIRLDHPKQNFHHTITLQDTIVICLPDPLTKDNISCRVIESTAEPIGCAVNNEIDIRICLHAEIEVKAETNLSIIAKPCQPRDSVTLGDADHLEGE